MQKLLKNQILFHRTTGTNTVITFYEVKRATTRTCELQEIRKNVVSQDSYNQYVVPKPGEDIGTKIRCSVTSAGAVEIDKNKFAWPWDGSPERQDTLVFL